MGKFDFSPRVRQRIKERDGGCIFCRALGHSGYPAAQIMHYVPRSHGGLGVEKNGAWGCVVHHQELDNGTRGSELKELFKSYLQGKYSDWDEGKLKYDKWRYLNEFSNNDGASD